MNHVWTEAISDLTGSAITGVNQFNVGPKEGTYIYQDYTSNYVYINRGNETGTSDYWLGTSVADVVYWYAAGRLALNAFN